MIGKAINNTGLTSGALNKEDTSLTSGALDKEDTGLTSGARDKDNASLTSRAPNKEKTDLSSASGVRPKKNCYAPIKHNSLRRKIGHDYASVCVYLISVNVANRERLLGALVGNTPNEAHIEPSPLGEYVAAAFRRMAEIVTAKTGSRVQVLQYQIMPDHFHGILYVREKLPEGWNLARMIEAWKGDCSREYWRTVGLTPGAHDKDNASLTSGAHDKDDASLTSRAPDKEREPLFEPNFNDKILFHEGQLQAWYEYLHDNPRRLWLKIHNPGRLKKVYDFQVGNNGHRYTAVGETFLVKYPERVQVRCHRNLSEEEIEKEVAHYLSLARSGAVLVSPFISPAEKAVYEACYREKLKMIRIVSRALDGKFVYPTGRDFQGCSEGFLLVLAPYEEYSEETRAVRISRATCLDMNAYAADLSTVIALTRDAHNKDTRA